MLQDGGSFPIGLRYYLMTFLSMRFVETTGLLS